MEQPHDWQRCRSPPSSSSTFSPCSSPKSLCTGKLRTRTKCTVTTTVHLYLDLQPTDKCVYFLTSVRSRVFCFMCACSATCNLFLPLFADCSTRPADGMHLSHTLRRISVVTRQASCSRRTRWYLILRTSQKRCTYPIIPASLPDSS